MFVCYAVGTQLAWIQPLAVCNLPSYKALNVLPSK